MEKSGWKVLAVVLILILIAENLFLWYSYKTVAEDDKTMLQCYYEICGDYADAWLDIQGICYCYDYDLLGNLKVVKTTIMD